LKAASVSIPWMFADMVFSLSCGWCDEWVLVEPVVLGGGAGWCAFRRR
jgi:hypothetical protein